MNACPACSYAVEDGAIECPACGIVIAKWRPRPERRPRSASAPRGPAPSSSPRPAPPGARATVVRAQPSSLKRWLVMASIGGLGGALIAGGYWWIELRPRLERINNPQAAAKPGRARSVDIKEHSRGDFDRSVALPGSPAGLAAGPGLLLTANREEPWGFVRLRPLGDSFETQKSPVTESIYNQRVSFNTVTWNGSNFVAVTQGSWFEKNDIDVFTIHDPENLRVVDVIEAPPLLGGLVWDGKGYWGATRRNTRNASERALLYRFNEDLETVATYDPPAFGCQGLAWDGHHLWWVDVFDDTILVLDPAGASPGSTPRVVHKENSELDYLSGIAFFEGDIWIAEYDDDQIHRLAPELRLAWSAGATSVLEPRVATRSATPAANDGDLAQLRRQLRSDDMFERMRAKDRLEEAGEKIDYDRDSEPMDERSPEDTRIERWQIELQEGTLLGSWEIYFGEDLFDTEGRASDPSLISIPLFARYDITIEGGSLRKPKRLEFEASPGVNQRRDYELASRLGPGKYEVALFVHVQYIKPDGTGQILNRSGMTLTVER